MVMEYASGGALVAQDQLSPEHHMPEPMAQYYFTQIIRGLAYLHENKVVGGPFCLFFCSVCLAQREDGV